MNIAEFFVRISADAKGVDKGVAEATTGLSRLTGLASAAGAAIAAAFTVDAIADFGRSSIAAAADAEVVWNRLTGTLRTVGVEFNSVAGEVGSLVQQLQETTTLGDEDVANTLQTLVRISGDYAGSLRQVKTVADVAAGANIDLSTAAELVGKAMAGNIGTLARYGIVVKEGDDAMALLQERFRGMAENEAATLQGGMTQLSNAWGDFQEAIGNALVAASGSGNVLGRVTEAVRAMTGWVERNSEQLRLMGDTFVTLGSFAVRQLGYILEGFNRVNQAVATLLRWLGLLDEDVQRKLIKLAETPPIIGANFEAMATDVVSSMSAVTAAVDTAAAEARRADAILDKIESDAARGAAERTRIIERESEEQQKHFGDLADSIADFATNGKASMSDFVDSAIKDLTRLAIRMAAMKFFELFINPAGAVTSTAAGFIAPGVPSASLSPAGPSLSVASTGADFSAAALSTRPKVLNPREAALDDWWIEFVATSVGVAQSRGLRT